MRKTFILVLIVLLNCWNCLLNGQCTFTSTVPYYEDLQGITANNQLPLCWAVSSTVSCLTFTSAGSPYGAFASNPTGTNYFYTNGILLKPGIVYSVNVKYRGDLNGATNWSDLSLLLGTGQTTTGLQTLASTTLVTFIGMSNLSGTFTVNSAGLYHVAIRAISNATGISQYLYWDDLSISIPCNHPANLINLNATGSSSVFCIGSPGPTLTVSGAHTYTWYNGHSSATIIATHPGAPPFASFSVTGTSTLTGCNYTVNTPLIIQQTPNASIVASKSVACKGHTVQLTTGGGSGTTFNWSNGSTSPTISVIVQAPVTYSVLVAKSGCTNQASVFLDLFPDPVVIASSSNSRICKGESLELLGIGAVTYTWTAPTETISGNPKIVIPITTTNYSLVATDANGCTAATTVQVIVDDCTGKLEGTTDQTRILIFPNPGNGVFKILYSGIHKLDCTVSNLSGKLLCSVVVSHEAPLIDLTFLSAGIYYLAISNQFGSRSIKYVKIE